MKIKVVYEDKNLLVINKPAGLIVHGIENLKSQISNLKNKEITLVDWLVARYPEIKNVGDEPKMRPGIVHRLDKNTSGIMIIAKNQPTFEYLKNQFQERKVKKTYIALVAGKLKQRQGIINLPIGRSKSPLRRLASEKARGKLREAITEYKVCFETGFRSGIGYTLVEAYPKTGRTHQIRVHFKAIGHPVVCDKLYTKKPICPFGLNRQFLHAYSLELTLPDGSRSRFEAELPEDLEKVLEMLRNNSKNDIENNSHGHTK